MREIIISSHEASIPLCDAGVSAGGCGFGVGADRDALRDSRARSRSACDSWTQPGRSGALGRWVGSTDRGGAAVLQPAHSRGKDHDPVAAAGYEGAAGVAGARSAAALVAVAA